MEKGRVVQTGVDRLLELLKSETTLSLKNTALMLGVSVSGVLKWAKMLEEEDLLRIRYKFSTAYLELKDSEGSASQQKKELQKEKDILDEKLESTLNFLMTLETQVSTLKRMFGDVGDHFNNNVGKLQQNLKQLSKFQAQKEETDKKILASKNRFSELLQQADKRLGSQKSAVKQWYELLYSQIIRSGELMKLEQSELRVLEANEKLLEKRLADIRALLDNSVLEKMAGSDAEAGKLKKTLLQIEKRYLQMRNELSAEKAALDKLIAENEKTVTRVENEQKSMIDKIRSSAKDFEITVEELKAAPKKLKMFFDKKSVVEEILNRVHYNETRFKKKLDELMQRSAQLGKETSLEKFKRELSELKADIEDLGLRRSEFAGELQELVAQLEM